MTVVLRDGERVPPERAVVSVFDRGFLYGDGVFEVLRAYGATPFAVDEHLASLQRSALRLGLPLAAAHVLRAELHLAASALALDRQRPVDAHLRVLVTRGEGEATLAPRNTHPTRWVFARELLPLPTSLYTNGICVQLREGCPLPGPYDTPEVKSLSWLPAVLAARDAERSGVDEVLRVGPGGELLEAGAANVFVVSDGVLKTPSGPGLRLGVTRALVLALARSQGLPTQEGTVTREDVLCAEEVFLTSSVRELVPVVRVDDHEVGDGRPGAVTRALHRGYRARCPPSAHGAL